MKPQKETLLKQCGFNVDDRRFMWAMAGDMAGMGDAETSCQELRGKKTRLYIGYHCSKIWNDVRYVDMYVYIYMSIYTYECTV